MALSRQRKLPPLSSGLAKERAGGENDAPAPTKIVLSNRASIRKAFHKQLAFLERDLLHPSFPAKKYDQAAAFGRIASIGIGILIQDRRRCVCDARRYSRSETIQLVVDVRLGALRQRLNFTLDPRSRLILGHLKLVLRLKVHPHLRGGSEESPEPHGRIGGDRALPVNDFGQPVGGNPQRQGCRIRREPGVVELAL
jgi:hypothetical protein